VFAILSVPALIFVLAMLVFHTHLIFRNLTTKEYLDEKYETLSGNPYRKNNCLKNMLKL